VSHPGTGTIYMDDVGCYATNPQLSSCYFITSHNCVHNEDVGILCDPAATPVPPTPYPTPLPPTPAPAPQYLYRINPDTRTRFDSGVLEATPASNADGVAGLHVHVRQR